MAIAQWLGVSLGWAFGGPMGAIIGYALGRQIDHVIDTSQKRISYNPTKKQEKARREATQRQKKNQTRAERNQRQKENTKPGDFELSFLILAAVIIKADAQVNKRELSFVREYFIRVYGSKKAKKAFELFNGILKRKVATTAVCAQIRAHMDHASRVQLIHFLFGIAKSDGSVRESEIEEIRKIAGYLYVSDRDFLSIKAMFYDTNKNAYQILEISESVSNDEVKKAYRKLVKKHHPDKLEHLGEEHVKFAKEKFRRIQEAYEVIKKERGL